jgi:hypothetical protein
MAYMKTMATIKDVILVCDEHPDLDFHFSNGRLNISKGGN